MGRSKEDGGNLKVHEKHLSDGSFEVRGNHHRLDNDNTSFLGVYDKMSTSVVLAKGRGR